MVKEKWKIIVSHPNYKVSNYGRVYSVARKGALGGLLKPQPDSSGYMMVNLYNANKKDGRVRVHRLVAETWLPNPENKKQVNHINGVKHDNRLANLEWATNKENSTHAHSIGLIKNYGENNPFAKLCDLDIPMIRKMAKYFIPTKLIAKTYGVDRKTIEDIMNKKTWKHVK